MTESDTAGDNEPIDVTYCHVLDGSDFNNGNKLLDAAYCSVLHENGDEYNYLYPE